MSSVGDHKGGAVESKGLKAGALGLASATVIGVASTAPGYSLAASLGLVTAAVGFKAPAIMWISFIPMACIASAFFYLNRADPDCGTNFAWVTRSMGPRTGWLGGWSSMMADLIIMPSLAFIAAQYTFLLFGFDNLANNTWCILGLGIIFIMGMTWVCVVGIELSARTQMALLIIELAVLVLFSVVALYKVYAGTIPGSVTPSLSWLTPVNFGGASALTEGLLAAVFIYWGWDTATSVNEESDNPNTTPGLAGVISTIILVLIFVVVAFAAQAVKGADFLSNNSDDVLSATGKIVFGDSGLGWVALKLLIIAVLSSSAASCQTTILPAARTALSMAMHRAFPPKLGEVDPVHLTPAFSTWLFGIFSSLWFALLMIVSRYGGGDVLTWSVDGVGLMIAYYYGQTGFACVLYYRRYLFTSFKNFIFVGLLPLIGGLSLAFIFLWTIKDTTDPAYEDPPVSWLGWSPVLWLGLGTLLAGIPLMYWWNTRDHAFFRTRPDPIDSRPPPEGGDPLPSRVEEGAPR
ncbi:MAG: APC family permease [Acidimicrobiia bacterium]